MKRVDRLEGRLSHVISSVGRKAYRDGAGSFKSLFTSSATVTSTRETAFFLLPPAFFFPPSRGLVDASSFSTSGRLPAHAEYGLALVPSVVQPLADLATAAAADEVFFLPSRASLELELACRGQSMTSERGVERVKVGWRYRWYNLVGVILQKGRK
jgi:hypothetical protein